MRGLIPRRVVRSVWIGFLGVALAFCCMSDEVGASRRQQKIRFDRISLEQGLSQGTINAILQDRQGFMWFGTEDGLNRFDGYSFTTYKHDSADPASLSHSFIWDVVEDRKGMLWVGTNGGGLNRWDPTSFEFTRFPHDPDDPNTPSLDRVRVLLPAGDETLYIGTDGGGLDRFDPATDTWSHYRHEPEDPGSLSHDRIRSVLEDRGGNLWVGTYGGGLNRLDPVTGRFEHYRHDADDATSLSDDKVYSLYEDGDGIVWVGTYTGGLNRLERASGGFTRFDHDPDDPRSLGAGRIRSIYQDRTGVLWVGTDSGLFEWVGDRDGFVGHPHRSSDARSLSDDKVTAIYEDRGGVLWVGTKGDGLNKRNPSTTFFDLTKKDPTIPTSLNNDVVAAIQSDPSHDLVWIGTFGGGLNRLDRGGATCEYYTHDPGDPHSLGDDRVMSLLLDRQGILWIGTYDGGLDRFDPGTGRFTHYTHDPSDPDSISANSVMALYEDRSGRLWIGTFEGGLNRLDPDDDRFVRYRHDPENPRSLGSNTVTSFFEDAAGVLWIGTDGGGLNRLESDSDTFRRYNHEPNDATSLSSDVVWSIHEDHDGTLWIGTQGGGLNRWESADRKADRPVFTRYTERDGLPNNLVYGILSDDDGHLWISTNKGLAKFDPQTEIFKNYDTTHGLQSNEFNFGAYHRGANGEMFFGGIKGLNFFDPSVVRDNEHVPPVVLTSFLKLNQRVDLEQPLSQTEEITLGYKDYVVSFEFAALDYAAPEKNNYAYKLEGFDGDWIELGTTRRATYTNLDAGDYVLRVKGSNNDGVWNEQAVALGVHVLPPPWKTWWAYSLYGMALIGAVLSYTRAQAQKLRREAEYSRKLEKDVQARTQELAQRNDDLQQANSKLEQASLTDSLTGLRNRRYLMTEIDKAIALTERYYTHDGHTPDERTPAEADFLFLMIDLDGLKQINDSYGHMAGDRALLQMRDLLVRECRKSDTIIRWGGDEFLVVGRNMSLERSENLAERLRNAVAEHPFDLALGQPVHLSCSIGFAEYPFLVAAPTLVPWEHVVTIADRALYLAKSSGRNAWVALFGTQKTPDENLIQLINDSTEELERMGAIKIRTSIPDPAELVWFRS